MFSLKSVHHLHSSLWLNDLTEQEVVKTKKKAGASKLLSASVLALVFKLR